MAQPAPGYPAGFWQRSVAWSLDAVLVAALAGWLAWPWILTPGQAWIGQVRRLLQYIGRTMGEAILAGTSLPQLAITLLHDPGPHQAFAAIRSATWAMAWPALLAFALTGMLYHVAFECSPWHASPGKRLLGLRVADRDDRRPGIGRAVSRYLAGALSWATLNIGHLMATAGPDHLALHDRVSRTRVVSTGDAPSGLPAWAWTWLALLGLAGLGLVAWLAGQASSVMRDALDQALF
ncbi:RDD family protein [Lysobacter sp. F6437]|uniref:RDD family protein n=1 Tax=Lysobacter sp. F6437 TaxID=3459296 RepID=UPI00403DC296